MIHDIVTTSYTPDRGDQVVSGGVSALSAASGMLAMFTAIPGNTYLAGFGLAMSAWIQVKRLGSDKRLTELTRDNFHLQAAVRASDERALAADAREVRHLARIDSLVRQLDAANARADRMLAAALEHSSGMGSDIHRVLAKAGQPVPCPPAQPAPPQPTLADIPAHGHVEFEPHATPDPDA